MKKIGSIDSMPAHRERGADLVNAHFNRLAFENLHRDHAHAHKRAAAKALLAGGEAHPEFHHEAAMRGVTAEHLATEIVAKPDAVAARELARQQALARIRAAKTNDDINAIVSPAG